MNILVTLLALSGVVLGVLGAVIQGGAMIPKVMRLLLFLVGFVLTVLASLSIFNMLNTLGPIERWVVFASGIIICVISYAMARGGEELAIEESTLERPLDAQGKSISELGQAPPSHHPC